ncbi:MAG: hypothetical protein KME20_15990 [Kaiparowitsia implicata GSE-PSE-MK54-09C]|jgi:hypothetical protein|nr:hypothetical protein [Kaiparowitsia implicata GSE-PSE-MK54-09C]
MHLLQRVSISLIASTVCVFSVTFPVTAANDRQVVCTSDQVLPGLGFLPITFSPFIAGLFGVNPADCQTPVERF